MNTSPLSGMTSKVLARATATGVADYRFKLGFPLAALDHATVQGSIALAGNDIQITPETPRMARARGSLVFSETGFGVNGGQVRALGGDARIDGVIGAVLPGPRLPQGLRIQGVATAEGLRQAKELGLVARLAQYANGSANYTATIGARGGVSELLVASNLSGLGLTLPAPFAKTAEAVLPLRLDVSAVPASLIPDSAGKLHEQDQIKLEIGRLASVAYLRDVSGAEAKVLRGSIAVGLAADEAAPLPDDGVLANVNTPALDLDAWSAVLSHSAATDSVSSAGRACLPAMALGYLPTSLAVRSRAITVGGRKLNHVLLGGARDGQLWRANLDATELNGYVEYREPTDASTGRLYARLARLTIGPSTAQEVESLLEEQPASIPALDIVVEDFDLRGKKLGRVEVDAVNLAAVSSPSRDVPREWRLNRFNITTPEAVLAASGNWTNIVALAEAPGRAPVARAPAHRPEVQARHHRRGRTAGALWHAGCGAQWQGQD